MKYLKSLKYFTKEISPLFSTISNNFNIKEYKNIEINPFKNVVLDQPIDKYYENSYNILLNNPNNFKYLFNYITQEQGKKIKFDHIFLKQIFNKILCKNINSINSENKKLIYVYYSLYNYEDLDLKFFKNFKLNSQENWIDYYFINNIDNKLLNLINKENLDNNLYNKILINWFSNNFKIMDKSIIQKYLEIKIEKIYSINEVNLIILLSKEINVKNYTNFKFKFKFNLLLEFEFLDIIKVINKNYDFFELDNIKKLYENNIKSVEIKNLNIVEFYNLFYLSIKLNYNIDNFKENIKNYPEKNYLSIDFDSVKLIILIFYKLNLENIQIAFSNLKNNEEFINKNSHFNEVEIFKNLAPAIKKKIGYNKLNLEYIFKLTKILYSYLNFEEIQSLFKTLEFGYAHFSTNETLRTPNTVKNYKLFWVILKFKKIGSRKVKQLLFMYINKDPLDQRKKLYNKYLDVKKGLIDIEKKNKIFN